MTRRLFFFLQFARVFSCVSTWLPYVSFLLLGLQCLVKFDYYLFLVYIRVIIIFIARYFNLMCCYFMVIYYCFYFTNCYCYGVMFHSCTMDSFHGNFHGLSMSHHDFFSWWPWVFSVCFLYFGVRTCAFSVPLLPPTLL